MKKLRKIFASALTLAMLFAVTACGGGSKEAPAKEGESKEKTEAVETTEKEAEGEQTSGEGEYTIAIMPKLLGIPYFTQTGEGALKAGKELGVKVIYTGPTKADAAEQVKMIEDLINKGVDAIAVAPNDPAAVLPVLQKAKDAGILVLDWDSPTDSDIIDASVRQIDNKELGEHLVDLLVEKIGKEEGNYAVVTGGLSAANLNAWIDFGEAYAKEKYPGLKLVTDRIPSDEIQQQAYTKTLDLLTAYPELDGILGYSTVAPLGVAQAIRERGLQDKVSVVGTCVKEDAQDFLEDGSLDVGVLWDPAKLGYLTVGVAKTMLEGKELTDGMEIEGFGKIGVKEDGKTIIMGPPDDYTK
uniref:autoinducer 2 ABC transporter substrate-binding protein n=1 Tax=Anaerococcus mediterraneensis TaxID=1870984 RepID=UPI00093087EE|nr:autoinducer 2 ABC transporter substrate-binding protein [Anaerococcus mediterraneensis]